MLTESDRKQIARNMASHVDKIDPRTLLIWTGIGAPFSGLDDLLLALGVPRSQIDNLLFSKFESRISKRQFSEMGKGTRKGNQRLKSYFEKVVVENIEKMGLSYPVSPFQYAEMTNAVFLSKTKPGDGESILNMNFFWKELLKLESDWLGELFDSEGHNIEKFLNFQLFNKTQARIAAAYELSFLTWNKNSIVLGAFPTHGSGGCHFHPWSVFIENLIDILSDEKDKIKNVSQLCYRLTEKDTEIQSWQSEFSRWKHSQKKPGYAKWSKLRTLIKEKKGENSARGVTYLYWALLYLHTLWERVGACPCLTEHDREMFWRDFENYFSQAREALQK